MPPSTSLKQLRSGEGILMNVITAKAYTHNNCERVTFICKRPLGHRTYVVIGYENGTFSTAT